MNLVVALLLVAANTALQNPVTQKISFLISEEPTDI